MNKKFLSAILFGALVASAGSFVSCADNDSDIAALQDQNSELKAQLATLKTQLQAELKSAASEAAVAAVEAKLSTLDAATPENMAATIAALTGKFDTAEAKLIALETQIKALEGLQNVDVNELLSVIEKAKDNAGSADIAGLSGLVDALDADVNVLTSALRSLVFQPDFYVDGIEATEYTYLRYVALDPKADVYTRYYAFSKEPSEQLSQGADWHSSSEYNHRNYNVAIAPDEVWGYAHVGDLTYVWETPSVWDYTSLWSDCVWYENNNSCPAGAADGCTTYGEWGYAVAVKDGYKAAVGENVLNTIKFAVNPSNAKVTKDDVKFAVKNICAMTRADEASLKVDTAFVENGILTIEYWIPSADIAKLITANGDESMGVLNQKQNTTIVKLQAATATENDVESDWAALYETSIQPVAIALNAKAAGEKWYAPITCATKTANVFPELHKNPYEALGDSTRTAAIDFRSQGIDIAEYIELHLLKRDDEKADRQHQHEYGWNYHEAEAKHAHVTMTLAEAAHKFGFTYEFKLINYTVDDNKTNNSAYAHLKNGLYANSVIVPNTVEEAREAFGGVAKKATEKSTYTSEDGYEQGRSSVDKQPLVQVLVKKGDDVILDGYVNMVITEQIKDCIIDPIDLGTQAMSCADLWFDITWNQASELIYEQAAKGMGMTKLEFEETYALVKYDDYSAKQFDVTVDGENVTSTEKDWNDTYAQVWENMDPNGITNTILGLSLDRFDQQYVYEKEGHTDVIYVKFVKKGVHANVGGIIVPLQITLKNVDPLAYKEKNPNFWYSFNGAPETQLDEAYRMNVNYAQNYGNTYTQSTVDEVKFAKEGQTAQDVDGFVRDLNNLWIGKTLDFGMTGDVPNYVKGEKPVYYFHPLTNNVVVKDAYTNVEYKLAVDNNSIFCNIWVKGDDPKLNSWIKHEHQEYEFNKVDSMEVANPGFTKQMEADHSLNTLKGIYKNIHLYALTGDETKSEDNCIAEMNRYTGEVWYKHTERAKAVLNATGHRAAEEYAYIGIFLPTTCFTAYAISSEEVPTNIFPAYWLRPLDIEPCGTDTVVDAVNNASYITLFDKFNFVDWRDYKITNGADYSNIWLLAYYGVNSMTLDLAKIRTNMANSDITKTLLSSINPDIKISYVEHNKTSVIPNGKKTIDLSAYNKASMGVESTYNKLVEHFGLIKYENLGANVSQFDVVIPVTLGYDWGSINTELTVHVVGTEGNRDNE